MNKSRFLVFVLSMAIVLTVACTANEAEPVAQLNAAPVTNVPPTPTFTIDMLASYHPRTYYLRPGENLLSVAEMIAGYTPYEPEIVVEALVRFNAGRICKQLGTSLSAHSRRTRDTEQHPTGNSKPPEKLDEYHNCGR